MSTPTITAVRTRHGKQHRVTVTVDGEPWGTYGGARAARAACVVVSLWPSGRSVELRQDQAAGDALARQYTTPGTRRVQGWVFERSLAQWAVAIPVVDQ